MFQRVAYRPMRLFSDYDLSFFCFRPQLKKLVHQRSPQQHQIVCAPYFDYYIITVILLLLFECKRPYSLEYVQDLLRTWHVYH